MAVLCKVLSSLRVWQFPLHRHHWKHPWHDGIRSDLFVLFALGLWLQGHLRVAVAVALYLPYGLQSADYWHGVLLSLQARQHKCPSVH